MNTKSDLQMDQYFVRRLTPELLGIETAGSEKQGGGTGNRRWDLVWEGAAKVGAGIADVLTGALFGKSASAFAAYAGGKRPYPVVYGAFIVVADRGKLTVFQGNQAPVPSKSAEIYIVADVAGLPVARLTGEVSPSRFSALHGNKHQSGGHYAIDFWMDPGPRDKDGSLTPEAEQNLGKFLETTLGARNELSFADFRELAGMRLQPVVDAMLDLSPPDGAWESGQPSTLSVIDAAAKLTKGAKALFGLESTVRYRPGARRYPQQLILARDSSGTSSGWSCSCGETNGANARFCGECGNDRPSSTAAYGLMTSDAHEVILDLGFITYEVESFDSAAISARAMELLRPVLRRMSFVNLDGADQRRAIEEALETGLTSGPWGSVGEFRLVDFRSADSDWQLNARVALRERMRDIEQAKLDFEYDDADFLVRESRVARTSRDTDLSRLEQQADLNRERLDVEMHLNRLRTSADSDLASERIAREQARNLRLLDSDDGDTEMEVERRSRANERERISMDREDLRSKVEFDRSDELDNLDHEIRIDKATLAHTTSNEEFVDAARRRRDEADGGLEDRLARLRLERDLELQQRTQNIGIDRKRQEQELELAKMRSEEEMQLRKLQMLQVAELEQRKVTAQMSSSQLLAEQAASIAAAGGLDALTEAARNDSARLAAEQAAAMAALKTEMITKFAGDMRDTAVANMKAELLEKMYGDRDVERMRREVEMSAERERQAKERDAERDRQMAMMMAALGAQREASEKLQQMQERNTDRAEKWNENSIDAMAKVAAAASAKAPSGYTGNQRGSGNSGRGADEGSRGEE